RGEGLAAPTRLRVDGRAEGLDDFLDGERPAVDDLARNGGVLEGEGRRLVERNGARGGVDANAARRAERGLPAGVQPKAGPDDQQRGDRGASGRVLVSERQHGRDVKAVRVSVAIL